MTREDFTERKVETLERLNSISESLISATRNYYDTSENADLEEIVDRLGADVESIKGHLQQLEDMIGNIEELQCYESNIE